MSLAPAVLDALLAAGATAEMIVAAVKADSEGEEARKAAKRQGNRDRQAKKRAADRAVTPSHAESRVTDRDARDSLSLPPSPQTPQPPTHTHEGVTTQAREGIAPETATDWPERPIEALVAAVASPWLDPTKSPGLITTAGEVSRWRRDGASWEHDVLPVVTGLCAKVRRQITTWRYFEPAIVQAIADNRRALEIPEASHERHHNRPTSAADARRAATESRRGAWAPAIAKRTGVSPSPTDGGPPDPDGDGPRHLRLAHAG